MKVTIFKGKNGEWYWRFTAENGKNIADGAEGYVTESNALRAVRNVIQEIRQTKWEHE